MERTTSLAVYVAFAMIGLALLIYVVIQARPLITPERQDCAPEPLCQEYNQTRCSSDDLVRCAYDTNGCLVASSTSCPAGCKDGACQ